MNVLRGFNYQMRAFRIDFACQAALPAAMDRGTMRGRGQVNELFGDCRAQTPEDALRPPRLTLHSQDRDAFQAEGIETVFIIRCPCTCSPFAPTWVMGAQPSQRRKRQQGWRFRYRFTPSYRQRS